MWKLGLGAEVLEGATRFRVWAPKRQRVEVVLDGDARTVPLSPEENGYFSATAPGVGAGVLYRYRLDGGGSFPDPCSRFQPQGPHGPSLVVDPAAYRWRDEDWRGVTLPGQVLYELHVGAFTREGTFDAAARELAELRRLGVTLIEVMPVAEWPGRFNWGYDGVDLYAPSRQYGDEESLKRFVDAAHAEGLGVILDAVYNHLGPSGNYLKEFSDDYFTARHHTEWGEAINFDGSGAGPVREFFLRNACYWIAEFHLDGLRLDATQRVYDHGPTHILAELSRRTREAASPRRIVLIAENDAEEVRHLAPVDKGGYGMDAVWTDGFHHAARVALTGRREAFQADYSGRPQEFIAAVKRGFLYQGQRSSWHGKEWGTPVTTEPAQAFVFYLQNHDQIANHLDGTRLEHLASPGAYRAMTALLLLAPQTPLLFMGQEFGASSPFTFFADHEGELDEAVRRGRKAALAQFPSCAQALDHIPDPGAESTFARCKLDVSERRTHRESCDLHRDLLRIRRDDPVISAQSRERIDGAVLSAEAFVLRFFGADGDDRLLLVNLGADLDGSPPSEPLLAPGRSGQWRLIWSSDDPRYGGPGIVDPCAGGHWRLPGRSAMLIGAG
ncbi:MAG: malto-oligosyltrehalose trehalohydrolase [Nitrospirota bacterium]